MFGIRSRKLAKVSDNLQYLSKTIKLDAERGLNSNHEPSFDKDHKSGPP